MFSIRHLVKFYYAKEERKKNGTLNRSYVIIFMRSREKVCAFTVGYVQFKWRAVPALVWIELLLFRFALKVYISSSKGKYSLRI